jgi:hypothetical protein
VIAFDLPFQEDTQSCDDEDEWDIFNGLCQTVCNVFQTLKIDELNLVPIFRHSMLLTVFCIVGPSLSTFADIVLKYYRGET